MWDHQILAWRPGIRPLGKVTLSLLTSLLVSGCDLCNYTIDSYSIYKAPLAPADNDHGYSKQDYERLEAARAAALAKLSPEQLAAREEMLRKIRAQIEAEDKARASKVAAGDGPSKPPAVRFRKPTPNECAQYRGGQILQLLLGIGLIGWLASKLLVRVTGRSLLSWLSGSLRRP